MTSQERPLQAASTARSFSRLIPKRRPSHSAAGRVLCQSRVSRVVTASGRKVSPAATALLTSARRAGGVEVSRDRFLRHSDGPLGEVALVDDLIRVVRVAGREHLSSLLDPHGPVGEAVGGIGGPDDQTGADNGGAARERGVRDVLAEA